MGLLSPLDQITGRKSSLVSCEYTDHPDIGCAYIDRYASYLDVFQYIKSKGHDNVAFTSARGIESISTQQTIAAYKKIFGEINSHYHISHCYSMDDGYEAGQKLLSLRERPTAIYANGDEVAGGIYQYARSIDYEIPNDVAIIGQENQPIGIGLGLSSVDHQLIKVGEQAFDLAVNKSKLKMKIPYHIIHRLSI